MAAGRDVFLRRGYHRTRVDDITSEAGVSHGAFYRYFSSKEDLAQCLAGEAMRAASSEFEGITALGPARGRQARTTISAWLRRYSEVQSSRMAVIRLWVDASHDDLGHSTDAAAVVDTGRRQLAAFLAPRGFGDPEIDALVGVAFISSFGFRQRSPEELEAATHIVERGFLGN